MNKIQSINRPTNQRADCSSTQSNYSQFRDCMLDYELGSYYNAKETYISALIS